MTLLFWNITISRLSCYRTASIDILRAVQRASAFWSISSQNLRDLLIITWNTERIHPTIRAQPTNPDQQSWALLRASNKLTAHRTKCRNAASALGLSLGTNMAKLRLLRLHRRTEAYIVPEMSLFQGWGWPRDRRSDYGYLRIVKNNTIMPVKKIYILSFCYFLG